MFNYATQLLLCYHYLFYCYHFHCFIYSEFLTNGIKFFNFTFVDQIFCFVLLILLISELTIIHNKVYFLFKMINSKLKFLLNFKQKSNSLGCFSQHCQKNVLNIPFQFFINQFETKYREAYNYNDLISPLNLIIDYSLYQDYIFAIDRRVPVLIVDLWTI